MGEQDYHDLAGQIGVGSSKSLAWAGVQTDGYAPIYRSHLGYDQYGLNPS